MVNHGWCAEVSLPSRPAPWSPRPWEPIAELDGAGDQERGGSGGDFLAAATRWSRDVICSSRAAPAADMQTQREN